MVLNHSIRVAHSSYKLAALLKLPKEEINSIFKSALYHDLGKENLNPDILNKKTKLTKEEFNHIKKHSLYGYKKAHLFGLNNKEALNILCHHENYNGTGYPNGLKGSKIPLGARIIRICDVFDALTSDRPYKERLTINESLEIMENEISNFDPKFYNVFIESVKKPSPYLYSEGF